MNNKFSLEAKQLGIIALDLVIVAMCVVFVCTAASAVMSFHDAYDRGYKSDSLSYRLRDENYAMLAEMTWRNRMHGMGEDVDLQEYYAVADYYEAAIQYRLCLEAGDADRAEAWLAKMNDAERRLGVFSPEKEKLDQMLGIQ